MFNWKDRYFAGTFATSSLASMNRARSSARLSVSTFSFARRPSACAGSVGIRSVAAFPPNDIVRAAASTIGQQIEVLYVSSDREIESAFTTLVQRGAGTLLAGFGGVMLSQRERIAALAALHRIPAIYSVRDYVAAGGLMSYAQSMTDVYRQAGIYAGRILKGEKPSDLPVLLPTKFELVINLKTAKALGIEVPDRLLALADEVIE
jgi:putative tryptophan/tyrosine transport system substrate-binding protein